MVLVGGNIVASQALTSWPSGLLISCEARVAEDSPLYTVQISIARCSSVIGSCPWLGEYSWDTKPV